MQGLVIKSTGNQYNVRMESGEVLVCRIRGNLRLKDFEAKNPVTVGDKVEIDMNDVEGGIHWISKLIDRKNYIIRKSVKLSRQVQIIGANIDRAFVVATPVSPKTSLGFIDRFLSTAEAYRIPGAIIWNKADIYDESVRAYIAETKALYEPIGYKVFVASSVSGEGIEELKAEMAGKVNLFSGHSGVGKSSLINYLIPGLNLKTAVLSSQHQKGVHTTTFAEMHSMENGGFIIDTPGIR